MDIPMLTRSERFALVTAMDDREFQLERDIKRDPEGRNGRRGQIVADLKSARAKLAPLLETVSDPRPGVSYKERL